jgi:triphosphatase
MSAEIEIKYNLPNAHAEEHIIKDEQIQSYIKDPFKLRESRSEYYDTHDWLLSENNYALRITLLNDYKVVVLKQGSLRNEDIKGLYRGNQWFSPFNTIESIVSDLMDRGAPSDFAKLTDGKTLEPCFNTVINKNKNILYLPDRTRVEISFNIGELFAESKHMQLFELGLELLYGSEELFINFSEQLKTKYRLTPVLLSKQESVLRFLRSRWEMV